MGKQKKPSPAELQKAFAADLAAFWADRQAKFANDRPYAFVLYGVEGGIATLYPQILTENGLTEVAKKYHANGSYDTLDEARDGLRWSVADSPWLGSDENDLPTVNDLYQPYALAVDLDEYEGYQMLAKAAIAAFQKLDSAGTFGEDEPREALTLAVIVKDTANDWALKSVRATNPTVNVNRFRRQTAVSPYENTAHTHLSADGRRVYVDRGCANPKGRAGEKNEFLHHIVCFDLDGTNLRRRWAIDSEAYGTNVRSICCTPDDKHLLAVIARYDKSGSVATLLRLDAMKGSVINQRQFKLEPAAFAVSPDGQYLALSPNRGALLILDSDGNVLHEVPVEERPAGLLFLRNGELLAGGETSIIRIDPATGRTIGSVPVAGVQLSPNADQTLLAASRWFDTRISFPRKDTPFGLKVLSLPAFSVVNEIDVPGLALVNAALSPDGRLIAVPGRPVEGSRNEMLVIDRQTGEPLARRQIKGHELPLFTADGRTVFVPNVEMRRGKSLVAWAIGTLSSQ